MGSACALSRCCRHSPYCRALLDLAQYESALVCARSLEKDLFEVLALHAKGDSSRLAGMFDQYAQNIRWVLADALDVYSCYHLATGDPVSALAYAQRSAQLAVMRAKPHPFYWSAFQLTGVR